MYTSFLEQIGLAYQPGKIKGAIIGNLAHTRRRVWCDDGSVSYQ